MHLQKHYFKFGVRNGSYKCMLVLCIDQYTNVAIGYIKAKL